MSTVLWANLLVNGTVRSEEEERRALFVHTDRLDALCTTLGIASFAGLSDSTDARCNLDEFELPEGMASTNDHMALHGVWMALPDAIREVVQELTEVLALARGHGDGAATFNSSIVG